MENREYQLPDQAAAKKRTRTITESTYDLFSLTAEARELGAHKTYYIRTYGCQANVRDGETIAGMMEMMGFVPCTVPEAADVLIFNTCAVRRAAEERVLGEIGALKGVKRSHPEKVICICGCMAQEEAVVKEILDGYPQVDIIFGTHNIYRFPHLLSTFMNTRQKQIEVYSEEGKVIENMPVKRSTPIKGYVNIMYGCNKFCTYCIVPYTRGKERSRQKEDILKEITELRDNGCKEVILLGQNVNAYGKDISLEDGFTDLLASAAETGIERIRFYTSHPRDYSVTTIDVMKEYANIMPALHLPVQSGSDEVLRRMARGYTAESYRKLYDEMRSRIDHITFTTDIIVGFPGESDEQFEKTLDLLDYCRFDSAFSFIYSPRAGTPAAQMPDDTPLRVKKERLRILNERIGKYANENNQKYKDRILKVLCEGPSKKKSDVYGGYSEENKLVNFTGPKGLEGQIVDVKITEVHSYSLDGKVL